MIRKCLSMVLVGLILGAGNLQIVLAQSSADNSAESHGVEKLKTEVYHFGLGEKAKIIVKMKDGTQLKGYISQAIADSFDLTDSKTKQFTTIPYQNVAEVKKQGWSKGAKFAVAIGIVSAIIVVTVVKTKSGLGDFCPLGCGPF